MINKETINNKIIAFLKSKTFKFIAVIGIIGIIAMNNMATANKAYEKGVEKGRTEISRQLVAGFASIDDWHKLPKYLHTYPQFGIQTTTLDKTKLTFQYGKLADGSPAPETKGQTITLINGWKFKTINAFLPMAVIEKNYNGKTESATLYISNALPKEIGEDDTSGKYYLTSDVPGYVNESNSEFEALKSATPEKKLYIFAVNERNSAGVVKKILKLDNVNTTTTKTESKK